VASSKFRSNGHPIWSTELCTSAQRATILLRIDWLSAWNGALLWRSGRLKPASGSCPAGSFAQAGLRWCGGWRRINFRGSHDQAKDCEPLNRPKDRQAGASQTACRWFVSTRLRTRYQTRPHHRHAAETGRYYDRSNHGVTDWQQHSVRGFLAGVVRKKLGLNLVSERTDKGRLYSIKDGKASSGVPNRAQQAA
jgi:Protein of unknown function (DUF3489)